MSRSRQFCSFLLERRWFGIEVDRIQEVLRSQRMTRVPLAPPCIGGLMNLRGQVVTAIELRSRLELPPRAPDALPVNIVIRSSDGPVSLLVDEIGDVLDMEESAFEAPPETMKGEARRLVTGAYKLKGRLLLALDIDRTIQVEGSVNESG